VAGLFGEKGGMDKFFTPTLVLPPSREAQALASRELEEIVEDVQPCKLAIHLSRSHLFLHGQTSLSMAPFFWLRGLHN